ncbi:MAG: energy transducer TonB [bacterium]
MEQKVKKFLPITIAVIIHVAAISLFLLMSGHFISGTKNKEDVTSISIEGDPNKKIGLGSFANKNKTENSTILKDIDISGLKKTKDNGRKTSASTTGDGEGGGTGFGIKTNYAGMVIEKIHSHKHYPIYAQKKGITGVVTLRFTLKKDGSIKGNIEKVKLSGNNILDEAGVKTVENAAPFPPFPNDIKEQELTFKVDIDFVL